MLGDKDVQATIAVKDMERSRNFYEGVLGLVKEDENPGGAVYRSGNTKIFVYVSEFAGTNQATALTWEVSSLDEMIDALKGKGVNFEHYDNVEGMTREGDIHIMGSERAAWFKDPDGNILNINQPA